MKKEVYYLGDKAIADLYYMGDKEKETKPFTGLAKEYKKLIDFFGVQPPKITIQLVYSRNEMDKHWGSKSHDWLQAMVDNDDPYLIYIFSSTAYKEFTKRKKEEILPVIIHEIAHTFVSVINNCCFYWANEGICEFVLEKNAYSNEIKKDDWAWFKGSNVLIDPEIKWSKQVEYQVYAISYNLVKYIIKKYGKNVMFDILIIKRVPDENLRNKMDKLLGGSIDKFFEDFEKTLKLV